MSTRGSNYGWSVQSGPTCYEADQPAQPREDCLTGLSGEVLAPPIVEYGPKTGLVISSAVIYRGSALPQLQGTLMVSDSGATAANSGTKGKLLVAAPQPAGAPWQWPLTELEIVGITRGTIFFWGLG